MTDDRESFRVARIKAKAKAHEKRLESATYTAAEVKVLTAKARQEIAEEIAQAIEDASAEIYHGNRHHLHEAVEVARQIGSKEASA